MIKDFLKNIENIANELAQQRKISLNERLESFNNEFAKEVEWGPAVNGGVGFRTRTMVGSENEKVKFRAALLPLFIGLACLSSGFFVFFKLFHLFIPTSFHGLNLFGLVRTWYLTFMFQITSGEIEKIIALIVALVFILAGGVILYLIMRPIKFESNNFRFTKGYSWARPVEIPFKDIKAIQILSEVCRGDKGRRFRSYELNLILRSKDRVTVVDHSDINEIRRSAKVISKMLSIPVWDLTST
jgi:hypothetical protein